MKKLLFFIIFLNSLITVYSQSDFENEWLQVKELESKGKPKSALDIIYKIQNKSKDTKYQDHYIKSVLSELRIRKQIEEQIDSNINERLLEEINKAKGISKSIFQSYYATFLSQYYNEHRWELLNKNKLEHNYNSDINTWDINMFAKQVYLYYNKSIADINNLFSTSIKDWNAIVTDAGLANAYSSQTNMYEVLALSYINFLQSEHRDLLKPFIPIHVSNKDAFASIQDFITLKFEKSSDTNTNTEYVQIVQLFQNILKQGKNNPKVLIQFNLERLKYFNGIITNNEKDNLYLKALEDFYEKYKTDDWSVLIINEISNQIQSTTDQNRYIKSLEWLEKGLKLYPKSPFINYLKNNKDHILKHEFNLSIEHHQTANTAIISKIDYKNISSLQVKIYKVDINGVNINNLEYDNEKWKQVIKNTVAIKTETINLNKKDDYQFHQSIKAIPALDYGYYLIAIGETKDFLNKIDFTSINIVSIYVSDISITHHFKNYNNYLKITNSNNGIAYKNQDIEIQIQNYNLKNKTIQLKSDENGFVALSKDLYYNNIKSTVIIGKDHKISNFYINNQEAQNALSIHDFIFTDRSIYRPGQIVYFKGIRTESNPIYTINHVIKDNPVEISIADINQQKISELNLITNQYGSFSGSFILPNTLANYGTYFIITPYGQVNINVEEYKRPKFEVKINPITEKYALNELINISGSSIAYSGYAIQNAKVSYKISRQTEYPFWNRFCWWAPRIEHDVFIKSGETKTDAKGTFSFNFDALSNKTLEHQPVYVFNIEVSVQNENGETHTSNSNIRIAEYSQILSFNSEKEVFQATEPISIPLRNKNLNDEDININADITIEKLEVPKQFKIKLPFDIKEWNNIDKNEFIKLFPKYEYQNESSIDNFKREFICHKYSILNQKNAEITMPKSLNLPGLYKVTAEIEEKGKKISTNYYFRIINDKTDITYKAIQATLLNTKPLEIGESAKILISSALPNQTCFVEIEQNGKILLEKTLLINQKSELLTFEIKPDMQGDIYAKVYTEYQHQFYIQHLKIEIPFNDKKLKIIPISIKEKLLPGEKTKFIFKIEGLNPNMPKPELLVAIYDASLDALKAHSWQTPYWGHNYEVNQISYFQKTNISRHIEYIDGNPYTYGYLYHKTLDGIESNSWSNHRYRTFKGAKSMSIESMNDKADLAPEKSKSNEQTENQVPIRSNFNETACFYPEVYINKNGEYEMEFEIPEALTKWKLMAYAHEEHLKMAYYSSQIITQKDLMITTNVPRFLRANDKWIFSSQISNLSKQNLNCNVTLEIRDAITQQLINTIILNQATKQTQINAEQSETVNFELLIPSNISAISYQIVAKADGYSDAEKNTIAVLPNSILVKESIPLTIKNQGTKTYHFDKLINASKSKTLKHHQLSIEFSSNPIWFSLLSLPYLMEFPHECAEQTFSRYYANSLALHLAETNPKIKQVFEAWQIAEANGNSTIFLSELEKNKTLNQMLIQETPWLLEGQNEAERKRRLAHLFNSTQLNQELQSSLQKLFAMQLADGSFPWFDKMPSNFYISNHILVGFGKLKSLGIGNKYDAEIQRLIAYLDQEMHVQYLDHIKQKSDFVSDHVYQYLYARSFFLDIKPLHQKTYTYWLEQIEKHVYSSNKMNYALAATALQRNQNSKAAKNIISALKEQAIISEEMGMYWKDNIGGYRWNDAPIETQAYLIEAFWEVEKNQTSIDNMITWLIKNKQTNHWKTTKATSEASFAILNFGKHIMQNDAIVQITLNQNILDTKNTEAGTGYFQKTYLGHEIKEDMGKISITKSDKGIAYGAMHWQYFEELNKITSSNTNLSIKKDIYVEKMGENGSELQLISEIDSISIGDKIVIRMILKTDRNLEYVHLKDMRAAGTEPLEVISEYRYKNQLYYYQSTKDAATHFFISELSKGTYVFEYELRANAKGTYQNGIAEIQCMYAPEFNSHSQGVEIKIK